MALLKLTNKRKVRAMDTKLIPREPKELIAAERKVIDAEQNFTEDFYLLGKAYYELREGETWKLIDCESWHAYCKLERLGHTRGHIGRLTDAYLTRPHIKEIPEDAPNWREWNEGQVRELVRVMKHPQGGSRGVSRVSGKIVMALNRNPKLRLSATLVRDYVDKDLGVVRKQRERKAKELERTPGAAGVLEDFLDVIRDQVYSVEKFSAEMWEEAEDASPGIVKLLTQELLDYASYLKE